MDLVNVTRDLWLHKGLVLSVICIAAVGALATQRSISLNPPSAESKSIEYGAAQTELLVDAPRTPIVNLKREFDPLVSRAKVYAQLMTSAPVKEAIGKIAGVTGSRIVMTTPVDQNQPDAMKEPGAAQRSNQILNETVPLRLFIEAQLDQPILRISSQAPTDEKAITLANAAAAGFQGYIERLQVQQDVPKNQRVVVDQLGPATGGLVNTGADIRVAALTFFALLIGGLFLVLFIANVRRGMREPIVEPLAGPWPRPTTVESLPGEVSEEQQALQESVHREPRSG